MFVLGQRGCSCVFHFFQQSFWEINASFFILYKYLRSNSELLLTSAYALLPNTTLIALSSQRCFMAGSIKGSRWPACCSPPLSTLSGPSQGGTHKSHEKYLCEIDQLSLSGTSRQFKMTTNPTQLAAATGEHCRVFGRISALI